MRDVREFWPLNGWMVVVLDKDSGMTESGLIHRFGDAPFHLLRKATVFRTSKCVPVRKEHKDGSVTHSEFKFPISEGTRIIFPWLYSDPKIYMRQFRAMYGDEYCLLKHDDVLLYDSQGDGLGIDDVSFSDYVDKSQASE